MKKYNNLKQQMMEIAIKKVYIIYLKFISYYLYLFIRLFTFIRNLLEDYLYFLYK